MVQGCCAANSPAMKSDASAQATSSVHMSMNTFEVEVRLSWPLLGAIAFLVIFASILGVSALHLLMRRGEATRVASMMYLPPVFAVGLEMALFGVVPVARNSPRRNGGW